MYELEIEHMGSLCLEYSCTTFVYVLQARSLQS